MLVRGYNLKEKVNILDFLKDTKASSKKFKSFNQNIFSKPEREEKNQPNFKIKLKNNMKFTK